MSKMQKMFSIFIFILSLGIIVSTFNITKGVIEKDKEAGKLALDIENLSREGAGLKGSLDEKDKELSETKRGIENLNYRLEEEKKRAESFQTRYKDEKTKADNLKTDIDNLKNVLQGKAGEKEKLSVSIERLEEEKGILSKKLDKAKLANAALEAFIAEGKIEADREKGPIMAEEKLPFLGDGKIIAVYPAGFVGVELVKSPLGETGIGKLITKNKEIDISKIHSHILILEAGEGDAGVADIKKGDTVKYSR